MWLCYNRKHEASAWVGTAVYEIILQPGLCMYSEINNKYTSRSKCNQGIEAHVLVCVSQIADGYIDIFVISSSVLK